MDRLFLDANVLFSAAYGSRAGKAVEFGRGGPGCPPHFCLRRRTVRNQAIDSGLLGVYNQGKEDIKEII
ncbi:MAG: hypothetical protein QHH75_06855 [Bacillota bacterium]|nr:hypothetical protein [Bacillota bacterium]